MGRQMLKVNEIGREFRFSRHYQWSALPLSYSSAVGNSLTESIHGPQPLKTYPATIGRNRHHSAGAGGEFTGNLFGRRSPTHAEAVVRG